ncbi:Peptide chain release factor 1 like [Actinidia chinensis var. chinensis]|uniref:Peptide chain release factor 1 like n=1 Tax=Actinidia chinensis var. chinensis TaxID=1590841 RepID=A0A2R6PZK5_ACTCC|nr:Peptide chain release factor 1 like [Actinidia chinensis var. chinensis]
MKHSTSSTNCSLSTLFTDDEIEVSEILPNLPNLIFESEPRYRFSVKWGDKRRRSGIGLSPSPSLLQRRPKVKAEASSPATPLSFSPSESDEKSKHSHKKVTKKRTREEWLEIIDGLIQSRELLRGEIETVKSYFKKLKAINLDLKAKQQEIRFCIKTTHSEIKSSHCIIPSTLAQKDHPQTQSMVHQQPLFFGQTVYGSHTSENLQYPYGHLGKVNHMGALLIPDLNIAAEETFGVDNPQPLDQSRVKAAEARRRRFVKMREMKNSVRPPR